MSVDKQNIQEQSNIETQEELQNRQNYQTNSKVQKPNISNLIKSHEVGALNSMDASSSAQLKGRTIKVTEDEATNDRLKIPNKLLTTRNQDSRTERDLQDQISMKSASSRSSR